jgi:hypothetical protein
LSGQSNVEADVDPGYSEPPCAREAELYLGWKWSLHLIFVPPLPASVSDQKQRITTAVASVDEDMLRCDWNELNYRIEICRVTKGKYIEQL